METVVVERYSVTKEELDVIVDVHYIESLRMRDEILSRPDTLALLEAWRDAMIFNGNSYVDLWLMEKKIIQQIRENPDAVMQELKEKGVWKE